MLELNSETSTLVGDDEAILNRLSPLFTVGPTKYGGRGCFTAQPVPAKAIVFEARQPFATTVTRAFKKEVCCYCFHYEDGKTLKSRLSKSQGKNLSLLLYFCSPTCVAAFEQADPDKVLFDSLMAIEQHQQLDDPEPVEPDLSSLLLSEAIEQLWAEAEQWHKKVLAMKPLKRLKLIPKLSESDYMEAKYVVAALYRMYDLAHEPSALSSTYYGEVSDREAEAMELAMFNLLQLTENEKVHRYPYLLDAYINIYKFLYLVARPELQLYITPSTIRACIGRNLSNAFGIWSQSQSVAEDREFFGFGVYPLALFFNHLCEPNIVKKREGRKLTFHALRDIDEGEELCIDYGNYLNEPVEVRRRELAEWFFDCGCDKCTRELAAQP